MIDAAHVGGLVEALYTRNTGDISRESLCPPAFHCQERPILTKAKKKAAAAAAAAITIDHRRERKRERERERERVV